MKSFVVISSKRYFMKRFEKDIQIFVDHGENRQATNLDVPYQSRDVTTYAFSFSSTGKTITNAWKTVCHIVRMNDHETKTTYDDMSSIELGKVEAKAIYSKIMRSVESGLYEIDGKPSNNFIYLRRGSCSIADIMKQMYVVNFDAVDWTISLEKGVTL